MKHRILIVASLLAGLTLVASACAPATGGGGGAPNTPPVADLQVDVTAGTAPLVVSFDGTGSTDVGGTIINYFWDFGDGQSLNGGTVTHSYAPGVWTAQLLVTDNQGGTATASVVITATNLPPTADFSISPPTGGAPLNATFDASTLSADLDGSIVSYAWNFEEAGTASGATVTKTLPAGTFAVTLTVTDNNNATATKVRNVTASGTPAAPTGLHRTGQGCCDTYGDFVWNIVPGADGYEIKMDGHFLGGCLVDVSDVINGQVSSGRVQDGLLCLASQYSVSIRARANGVWGPWSGAIDITL